jgi:oligoendopeptidase F
MWVSFGDSASLYWVVLSEIMRNNLFIYLFLDLRIPKTKKEKKQRLRISGAILFLQQKNDRESRRNVYAGDALRKQRLHRIS